jgi:GR25 family glycosyltransferase involved in LPS biosynthesis
MALTWNDVLTGPAFLINMDRQTDRLASASKRLNEVGFVDVRRWRAVDGRNDDLVSAWKVHGSPKFDQRDTWFCDLSLGHPYKQGTLLSHLNLLKHIIDNNIMHAAIFEDDIVFHKDFNKLAVQYFDATPKDYDMCYMGHHCGCGIPYNILQVPVYCTHALLITYAGAKTLYNRMITDPVGVRAIDCQINDYMMQCYVKKVPFLTWYVWNSDAFPDDTARKHPDHVHKDMGLVFQEWEG